MAEVVVRTYDGIATDQVCQTSIIDIFVDETACPGYVDRGNEGVRHGRDGRLGAQA